MRLQPFFDDHRPTATGTPVRVFPAVAATPRLPEPGRWTNPILTLFVTMVVSVGLPWIPWLPVFTGLVVMALGVTLSVLCTISYLSWPDSREEASVEGAWVARQSGYRADVHGAQLRWMDEQGSVKTGHIIRGPEGWDLVLTDPAHVATAATLRAAFQQSRPAVGDDELLRDLSVYDRAFGVEITENTTLDGEVA